MAVFAVHMVENAEQVVAQIKDAYPKHLHYALSENLYLVSSPGTPQTIAKEIGLDGSESSASGVVLKLNGSYTGFYEPGVWDWLDLAYERDK